MYSSVEPYFFFILLLVVFFMINFWFCEEACALFWLKTLVKISVHVKYFYCVEPNSYVNIKVIINDDYLFCYKNCVLNFAVFSDIIINLFVLCYHTNIVLCCQLKFQCKYYNLIKWMIIFLAFRILGLLLTLIYYDFAIWILLPDNFLKYVCKYVISPIYNIWKIYFTMFMVRCWVFFGSVYWVDNY